MKFPSPPAPGTIFAADSPIAKSLAGSSVPGAMGKVKEGVCTTTGTYRIKFTINAQSTGGGFSLNVYGTIYKNGVAYGTARTVSTSSGSLVSTEYIEDLAFTAGDLIQVYGWYQFNVAVGTISLFSINGAFFPNTSLPTINL